MYFDRPTQPTFSLVFLCFVILDPFASGGIRTESLFCTYAFPPTLASKFPHPNPANPALLIVVVMLPAKHKI